MLVFLEGRVHFPRWTQEEWEMQASHAEGSSGRRHNRGRGAPLPLPACVRGQRSEVTFSQATHWARHPEDQRERENSAFKEASRIG